MNQTLPSLVNCEPFKARKFSLPRNPQETSCFLRLPFEIRVEVLQQLERPVLTPRPKSDEKPSYDYTGFSAALLTCCQQLFYEGIEVFYDDRTLHVICELDTRGGIRCIILNASLSVPVWHEEAEVPKGDIFAWREETSCDSDRESYYPEVWRGWSTFAQNLPAVLNHRKISIDMHTDEMSTTFVWCRVLQSLVAGRQVSLYMDYNRKLLRCCDIWKCETLRLTMWEINDELDYVTIKEGYEPGCRGLIDNARDTLPLLDEIDTIAIPVDLEEYGSFCPTQWFREYRQLETRTKESIFSYKYDDALRNGLALFRHLEDLGLSFIATKLEENTNEYIPARDSVMLRWELAGAELKKANEILEQATTEFAKQVAMLASEEAKKAFTAAWCQRLDSYARLKVTRNTVTLERIKAGGEGFQMSLASVQETFADLAVERGIVLSITAGVI